MDDKKPNPFDQFDPKPAADGANPFDKFDEPSYQPPGMGARLKDLGVSLASGLVGVPETAVGLADLVTGGQAGKKVQQAGVDFHAMHDALHQLYSPAQQEANAAVEQAKGFVPTIAAMVQNPSTIVQQAVESAPTMLSGGLLGRGLLKAVPKVGAIGAGAFGEGATAAGQNTEQVRQEDPNGLLTPQQAGILAASGALTGAIGLGAGQLANKLGIGDAATMLAAGHLGPVGEQAAAVAAKKGVLRKIGEGALVEGIGQELPQSYQEQVAQNVAQGKPWDEGAAAAGAQGMLAGGLMGAVSGPLHSGHEEHAAAPAADSPVLAGDQPLAPPAAPAGPLTRAAAQVEPQVLFPFRSAELAQKQADLMTTERGVPYEVIDHPSAAGKFAAVPAKPKEASDAQDDVGAAVRAADLGAAGPDGGAGLDQPAGAGAVGGAADGTGAAAGAGAQDAAGQAAARQRDAAPVGLQPGEPVQVTLGGVDQFEGGTRVRALSDDGQYATVEGSDAAVPLASLTRIDPAAAARLDEGAHQAATSPANARPEPTEGQKQAGNYKKGPATLQGLDLSIENPAGSTRSGVDRDGAPWQTTMQNHYGYIRGTEGADNEHIDAYVGPNPASHRVFVVDQVDPRTGQFDEHKVMLGFNSQEQARAAYDAHYAPDWQGGAHMTATTIDGFKQWMQGDTTEPFNPALLEQAAAPGRQQDQAPDTSTPKGEAPLSDQQLSDLFDQAERETAAEQQQGQNPADEAKVMAEKLRAEHDAKDQADLKAEAEALYGDIDRQIQQAAAAGDVQQLMALTEQRARLLGLHPPAVDEAQQDRAPGGSQAAPPAPEQADSAAAHLQAISDQVARTGTAYVGDVFAPGHKRTGIDQDDNAAAQVHDDAYRTALRDAGWQLVPKTPAQVKAKVGGETWTKDGQRLLMNHPIVGKPASLLLQPAPGADPRAELAAAKANPDGATLSPAAQALNEQEGAARFAGAHPQLAPQDTPAAPAAANSAQFDAYKKAIEAGQTSPGMLEQIHADERLNDGEAEQLTALAKAKAPQANVPEPQPTGKTSSGEDAFAPTPEQYRAAGQQVAAAPFFRTRGAYYQVDRMRADGTVEGRLMNMATLKPRGAGPDMHRFILQNGQLGLADSNPGHEGGSVTFHPDVELLDKLPVDAPHPDNAKKFAELDPRVLKALEPGQYGGRLTAERLGGILGDADKPGTTIGTERAQKALDRLVIAGKVVKDGQSYKLADKTRQDKPGAVDYPNRSLGFQKAATSEQDAYNDHAWANIAAANMQKGDTFKLNGKQQSVESITDKTLKLKDADGKVRTLNPDGAAWGQFVRDLGGQLGAENLQANNILKPKRPLLEILKRDPAVHVDANGSVYLKDGGPVDAAPAKAAPEQQAAVPEAIAKLFRTGSSTGLSAFEEKQARALMAWGYDASNMRFNMFGRPADTIGPMEIALSAGSENKIRLMVTVAHAPNGKWGVGISIRAPHTAATEGPSVFSPQFDTRLAAIEYGMQRWREAGLADLKKQREDQGGYIDSAFAKMEAELAALHGSAAPQPAPAGQGQEVSRFAGKFGKGMTEANAKMAAANRAKADPAHEYSVEEAPRHGPGKYEVVGREKASAPVQQAKQEAKPEAMAAEPAEDLADHAKWNQDREDRIAASRKNGNTHLDKLEKTVEAMRGKPFYNVHDRKEQGVVRSVDMHGNVVVTWKDSYSAGKNLVDKQTQDGKKQVWQSMLSPSDLKDYVVGLPKVEQAETPWKDSPFAARIDAVLAKLQAVDPDSVKFFRSGFETDARHNQLTEERVAFRENKANQIVGEKTGKVTPVPFTPIDAPGLQELTGVAKALPKEIVDAAIARWNPIAEQLAALGYRHGEVDKSKPQAAQELDAQLREIAQVLMGLAPRRYMAAKNQKGADPAKLAREEDDATRVLGLDTRQYPGIDTSRQITLGQGVKDKALPPVVSEGEHRAPKVDRERIVFKGSGYSHINLSAALVARVQDALRTRPDSYTLSKTYALDDTRIKLPNGGELQLRDNGDVTMLGDDSHHWGSTMSQASAVKTLDGWLEAMAAAPQQKEQAPAAPQDPFALARSWGYTDENMPRGVGGGLPLSMPGATTALDYNNQRSGKEQLAFSIEVLQAPNGKWAAASSYKFGGTTSESGSATDHVRFSAQPYDSREQAVLAQLAQIKREVPERFWMEINLREKAAKAALPPQRLPLFGVDKAAEAAKYGLPADFYAESSVNGKRQVTPAEKYRSAKYNKAEAAAARAQGDRDSVKRFQAVMDAEFASMVENARTQAKTAAAAPQDQAEQARQQRAAQRAAYNAAARLPSLLEAASLPAAQFREKAEQAVNDWVATELALAGSDGARRQMLDGLVADGKSTLPAEFYTSLHKYLQRAKRSAEQQAARDPEIYKQALLEASVQAGLPVDAPQVALFKDGWDHALAGRTKSTLRSGELPAKGYAAAMAWRATDAGAAWYTGKRGAKLENTGAELRRWFDERTRKIKEVSAADLPASYAIIKDQASRAGAFANLAGEGATPGTVRYIEAVRDALLPFQEWLVNHGPLRHLYGETGYRTTDAGKVERYLDGRTYVVHQQGEQRISGESDSAEDRLALLQSAAADYMERLQPLVAVLQGATTVAEAAARYTKMLYTETPEVSYRHRERLTEAGKRVDALFRRYSSQFVSDNYTVRELTKHENEPDAPGAKKQALLVPKLDRVVREGGQMNDWRGGKNVTPAQAKRDLGLADVGFGKWVGTRDDQDHLNYAYDALMDLAHLLGIEPKQIGLGGTLHLTIGALGHGRHAAHFQPEQAHPDGGTVPVINVTNTRGDGTVAHEWMHALDHALSVGGGYGKQTVVKGELVGRTWVQHPAVQRLVKLLTTTYDVDRIVERLRPFLTGDSFMIRRGRSKPTHDIKTEAGLVENASHAIDYLARQSRQTNYKAQADAMGRDYWGNERELVARAAEAYVLDTLDGTNNYLVNPAWVGEGKIKAPAYKGAPYPMGDERRLFNEAMGALLKSLRFENGKVTIDAATFNEQFPDVARQFKEALESIRAALPGMVHQALAEKEARRLAAKHAKDAAESAKQQQAQAEQAARDAAEQARMKAELEQAEQAPAQPPAGPLSDAELENLFDEAENQLAEQQQEQPEAAAPGEATQAGRWTQDDIRHLLEQVEDGKVILLADPALGLATIHDLPGAVHLGYGTFRVSTPAYEATFEGGGAMRQTPGGQAYTTVHISRGRDELLKAIHWDQAKTRLQARLIAKTGPKALPPLSAEQEKTAGQLIAEAAKLGVTGIDEALKGLTKLFGAGGGKLQSFPGGLDEEAYRQAKPHFEAALKAFQAAGKTLVDLFKMLIQNFGAGVRPYAIQFAKEQGLSANLAAPASATERVARFVETALAAGDTITSKALFEAADGAFGGTQAEGKYIAKDAYDAMEAGVNRYVMAQRITPDGSATDAAHKIAALEAMQQRLPTQTRRSAEMDEYQQFSTPPTLAFAAAWAANIKPGETVLEPSAGIGSLAMYAELAGADLVLNELSARRHAVLHEVLPEARLFKENAEQLDNVLPADINPGTVLMNPPFSSSAGRMAGVRDTHNGAVHVEQALKRLAPGGRLVAIVGNGMAADKPAFRAWWNKIKQDYNVRANVGVDGKNYAKYGTTFDNQLLVIDKTGPSAGPVVTGQVATVGELPALLEGIRNDRQSLAGAGQAGQPAAAEPDRGALPGRTAAGDGAGGADLDALGSGKRGDGATTGAGVSRPGQPDGANQRDDALGAAQRGEVPDQPGKPGGRGTAPGGTGRAAGRAGSGRPAAGESVQRDGGERPVSSGVAVEATDTARAEGALTDAIFEHYAPQRLAIPGATPHPGKLVQSAAMAAVEPPKPTYTPNLPKAVIDKGLLSLPQLEAVVYAGQAHREMLPGDKLRRGYFIGDGTGVGKGREIAGILLDNWRQGRKKAVWLSAKQGLLRDARRDFAGVSGDPVLLLAHNKYKAEAAIDARQGILFSTYDTLRSGETQKGSKPDTAAKSRLDQIVDWLGPDFDGVIAFDEAHFMGNALPKKGKRGTTKPAARALAGIELQNRLPNARIVYVSATGATEVSNLAYATRLGLWGEGSAFATPVAFVGGIEAGGVAAMELVSRDMKAAGSYLARSLSYDGVTYDRLEHVLTPLQNDIYNELAGAWQTVLQNVNAALEKTEQAKSPKAKSSAMAQFWGSHQRFFNHVITAMQMPSILESAQADLAAGNAVVMQLVNTNEAEQERQAAKIAGDDEAVLEDLDFTPRETLLNYVRNSFPVAQFEEYTDDNGNKQVRPVLDAAGKAVQNREMVARREQLVKTLEAIRVPDNPIDMIINTFGPDHVAEITGRKRRFVQVPDKKQGYKVVEQKRPASAVTADADAFMDDKKRVLVFSDAGGTGYSFQSDLGVKNQRRRMHYLVQPGWRADNAVQGFGRTHRSNEANQPHYVLPTTNLKAQKRFISSIARRLDQLGALTKGQRETGSQGMFSATDNLESQYASDALHNLFMDMYNQVSPLPFGPTTDALGLTNLVDQNGALSTSKLPNVPQFLNRLLSLTTTMQDTVFDEFFKGLEETIARAKANGTFDAGMETLHADKVEKLRDEVVHTDARTGAQTRYIELELTHPTEFNSFDGALATQQTYGERGLGFYRSERTGRVFSLVRTGTTTDSKGNVVSRGRREMTTGMARYGDDVDTVLRGARGATTVKKTITVQRYQQPAAGALSESYQDANGNTKTLTDTAFGRVVDRVGLERARASLLTAPAGAQRDAGLRLLDKMAPHLTDVQAEREIPAFTRLPEAQARAAWEAEQAATPQTYTSKTHLLAGMLLPIWDRLPGDPRVVRTQTADGERLLGRVVATRDLAATLRNLGVGSNLGKIAPDKVLERILAGERAVLANGWVLQRARVGNEWRVEVSGGQLAYSQSERRLLEQQGAFSERINWQERLFIPTGANGPVVLARVISNKPLVDLGNPDAAGNDADEAAFSRGLAGPGMAQAELQQLADALRASWVNGPPVAAVQSLAELPFKAPADTRGVYYQGRVWLVADNLHNEGEAQLVLAHEAFGHAGLAALMDPVQLAKELNRLRLINPALAAAARAQAAKYGYALPLATEEALAEMAASGKPVKGWQQFVAKVQALLRSIGLGRVADWIEAHTAAETMDLLRRAREAIEGKRTPVPFGSAEAARYSDGAATRWYSALARQLERLPMKAAPALQWAETIMGSGFAQKGVKQEEIEWSGVLNWLAMQQQQGATKVSKAALLDYLAGNGVRVEETMLGEPLAPSADGIAQRAAVFAKYQPQIDQLRARSEDFTLPSRERDEAEQEWEELMSQRDREADAAYRLPADDAEAAQYASYTLPGGRNYRELLLTLPGVAGPSHTGTFAFPGEQQAEDFLVAADAAGLGQLDYGRTDQDDRVEFKRLSAHDYATLLELARSHGGRVTAMLVDTKGNNYQSPHWQHTRNVLAHVRFNERTDRDGDKVLFVEELQSDWANQGRRMGFGPQQVPAPTAMRVEQIADPYVDRHGRRFEWVVREHNAPVSGAFASRADAEAERTRLRGTVTRPGAPRAPFVEKTDGWLALALKRVISFAAQNGFDKVAFINGPQAVERFKLSDRVDKIDYYPAHEGATMVAIYPVGADPINLVVQDGVIDPAHGTPHQFVGQRLEQVIGKELAERILADPQAGVIEGNGMEVGGDGMRAFYDTIVPNAVNDVLKRLGGGRIGPVHMGNADRLRDAAEAARRDGLAAGAAEIESEAQDALGVQPGFAIGEALRAQAQSGLPLFERRDLRLRAPNGRPSNLNPALWQQVRSPAFKAWFGDWENNPAKASQVVDENGEPRVVYHGTHADVGAFDKGKIRHPGGFWFAERNDYTGNITSDGRAGFNQMPVFLNIRRPIDGSRYAMARQGTGPFDNTAVQRNIKLFGSDGVRIDNGSDSVWIALEPTQVKSALGNNGQFDPASADLRFSRAAPEGESRSRAAPGANVQRLAALLGPQLYGDMGDMGPVTVKELFQNAFDALKGQLESGRLAHGSIEINTDHDTRTITVADNGAGMTPEIINKAFLTIAGTNKETTRSSGGFGIAKMLFLFGNKSLSLVTVRDGVEARLDTTGEQLMASFSDPAAAPEIVTRPTDAPNGTTVTVTLPAEYLDPSTGRTQPIMFPDRYSLNKALDKSPLFENITVRLNGSELAIGQAFPKDAFTTFSTVKFDWGTARIIVSKQEKPEQWGGNLHVLSNGLWQFGGTIKENPFSYDSQTVPREFYINVEPRLKPEEAGYPFALNRKGFSPAVAEDFAKIYNYLSVLYGANKTAEHAAGFGAVQYVNPDGSLSAPLQLAPKLDQEAKRDLLHINEGDKIEIHDGRMTVNGRAVPELSREQLDAVKLDLSKFKIGQDQVDPGRPMIHDNVDVKWDQQAEAALAAAEAELERLQAARDAAQSANDQANAAWNETAYHTPEYEHARREAQRTGQAYQEAADAWREARDAIRAQRDAYHNALVEAPARPVTEVMRARFGARFDRFLGEIGRQFMRLRDAAIGADEYKYGKLAAVPVGVSFDQEYYGVHTMVPFRAMFLNPAMTAVDDPGALGPRASNKLIATAMVGTMIHEIAHFAQMNHSTGFISEMERITALLDSADNFNLANLKQEVRSILDRNHDIYSALNRVFRGDSVSNRGVKLEDGSAYSARNAGPADAVGGAGGAGEDDGRVAGRAGTGTGLAAAGDERGGPGAAPAAAGDVEAASRRAFDDTVARLEQDSAALPKFARASPGEVARQAGAAIRNLTVTDVQQGAARSVRNKMADLRSLGLQFLGRQQIKDVYGELFPQGKQPNLLAAYDTLAMRMDAEKNEAGTEADAIASRWAKLPDEGALAELMHDATRYEIDPARPYLYPDDRREYEALRARWDALSDPAKALYIEARDAYERHYDQVKAAIRARIARTLPGHPSRAALLAAMEGEFFHKIRGVYFPLARFGDYMVQVRWVGRDPKPGQASVREAVSFAETMGQAEALRADLMRKYPAAQGYQVLPVTKRAEYNAARDSVSRGFLKKLFGALDEAGLEDPSLQDTINQLYLNSLPDLSWAKHGIARKGTPGFSQDARRAFAHHMFHGASYLAKLNYSDQLAEVLESMQGYANAHANDPGYDQVKAQHVVDEMYKRHDLLLNPTTSRLSQLLTSVGFAFYLGLSPASALVNLSQTAMVAYPVLGGRFGFAKAGAALLQASKDAVRGHNDMSRVLTGDELRAFQEWVRAGVVDVTMAHDLAQIASGMDGKLFGTARTALKAASFMFHHAERFNRQATALAAYRLARAQGMEHEAAYRAAVDATYASHFNYSAGNRPRIMQGNVAKVVLLFKQYGQNMIYTLARNAQLAFKGDRQAAKTFAGLLTTHALAAGVLGLPLVTTLLAAASMLGGSDDEPWDAEVALRNLLADTFGTEAGAALAHGLSRLTPWDVSARVGLNSMLLPDVQEGLEGTELADAWMAGLLGPVAGIVVNAAKGMHEIAHGRLGPGLETMLPAVLRGPLKAMRYHSEGIKDRTGVTVLPETTAAEEAGQALGFSPSRGREAQEVKSAIYQRDRDLQQRRGALMASYAQHTVRHEDTSADLAAITAFNALHPNRVIAPLHLRRSVMLHMKHIELARQGIYLPPKRGLDARRAALFGQSPDD